MEFLKGIVSFIVFLAIWLAGNFLYWRIWAARKPVRTQHIDDNRRIDGPDERPVDDAHHEAYGAMIHQGKRNQSD
jgi:hypothetical protein